MCAYDNGFSNEFIISTLDQWDDGIEDDITSGVAYKEVDNTKNVGSHVSVSAIEIAHLGYLHYLFRDAVKKKGTNASFAELAGQMNDTGNSKKILDRS